MEHLGLGFFFPSLKKFYFIWPFARFLVRQLIKNTPQRQWSPRLGSHLGLCHLWLEVSPKEVGTAEAGRPAARTSHVTDRKACVIQVQRVTILFLRTILTLRFQQSSLSYFGSWLSCRESLDLEAPWLDLGKRLVKSPLLQGKA